MELSSANRKQWLLLLLVVLGFGIYRFAGSGDGPAPDDLVRREEEIRNLWYRVPSYPGTRNPTGEKYVAHDAVIYERLYSPAPSYAEATAFYQKELRGAGWAAVGEQRNIPGFTTPVMVFRNGDYHFLLNTEENAIRLRITWSPDLNPLVDMKVMAAK